MTRRGRSCQTIIASLPCCPAPAPRVHHRSLASSSSVNKHEPKTPSSKLQDLNADDWLNMNIFTQKLIEKQSKVGGREYLSVNRASQSLLNSVKSRAPSNEQLAFAPGKPEGPLGEEDDMSLTECSPGTFVELRRCVSDRFWFSLYLRLRTETRV
jgi:hypothetical protein